MKILPSIVWFRNDLRIEDQPALNAAIEKQGPVIPLFIWAPEEEGKWEPGGASRWWLHGALKSLEEELEAIDLRLIICQGPSEKHLMDIITKTGADAVYWNTRFEPSILKRDEHIEQVLKKSEVQIYKFNGNYLFDPDQIYNKQNKPYQIFTPFWNFCSKEKPLKPLKKYSKAIPYQGKISSDSLGSLRLLPTIHWDKGLKEKWKPEINIGKENLSRTISHVISNYSEARNLPAERGTSELSPYLHFGQISPRMIWDKIEEKFGNHGEAEVFLREIGWREFANYLLYHFPETPLKPLQTKFNTFPWETNKKWLKAWQKGQTGYPIVDAGMRQLWHIGWMHNRVRMIVGSFLVKDLLIHWLEGARWFWDTLVDADLASNTLGWQWIGGCGADAAPYFRVFNPVTQGKKFDKEGKYIKQWIPELSQLPAKWIHCPWEAPEQVLRDAGIVLGKDYPNPIVDHDEARKKALKVFKSL